MKEKGITLIALVVTVIVLLILAGVGISMVLREDGIIGKAETAANNAENSQEYELVVNAVLDAESKYLTGDGTISLKQELEDSINKVYPETDVTENGDGTYVITLPNDHAYHVDADGKVTIAEKVELPEGLEIGSTVSYNPNGSYTWKAEYCSSTKTPETDDVLLESGTGKSFNLSTWKVFDINWYTGEVTLVPSSPTSGTVYLGEAQGYNNAVYLLNEACSKLYGNEAKGIKARSINIEDIEEKMKKEKLEEAHQYTNGTTKYAEQVASDYTSSKNYPSIYEQEKLGYMNGETVNGTLDLSEQDKLIGRSDNGVTNGKGYKEAETSIQPYQTYWTKDNSYMQTAFEGDYYNLIMPKGTSTTYWLASRCVDTYSDECNFNIHNILGGSVNAYFMFYGISGTGNTRLALFPVVSLDSMLIEGDVSSGFRVNVN